MEAVLDSGTGSLALDLAFARSLGLEPAKTTGMVPRGRHARANVSSCAERDPVWAGTVDAGPGNRVGSRSSEFVPEVSNAGVAGGTALCGLDAAGRLYPARLITFLPRGQTAACSDPIPFVPVGGGSCHRGETVSNAE